MTPLTTAPEDELNRPANSRRANNCTPISNDHRSVWLNHYVCAGATALNDLLSPGRYYGIYRTAAARHRLRAAAVNKTGAIGAEHAFSAVANDMGSYNHRACGSVQDAPAAGGDAYERGAGSDQHQAAAIKNAAGKRTKVERQNRRRIQHNVRGAAAAVDTDTSAAVHRQAIAALA